MKYDALLLPVEEKPQEISFECQIDLEERYPTTFKRYSLTSNVFESINSVIEEINDELKAHDPSNR